MKRKVCAVITARSSYSRVKSALRAMHENSALELQLVVAASAILDRYGNILRLIEQDGFLVSEKAYMVLEGENLVTSAKSTGLGLIEMATVFDKLRPDVVVTVADRFETIATAIAAAYMNIPLVHIQGGEVSGSIDEKVRHAITKLADLHFVANGRAAERVIRMGEDPQAVKITGCPSIDLAASILKSPKLDFDPIAKYGGVGPGMDLRDGYLVVLQHPVTTEYEEAKRQVQETLRAVRDLKSPTLWFWPNVDAGSEDTSRGIRAFRELEHPANIHFFKNMQSEDFLRLAYGSLCVIGNSSVAIRECAFLGVPAVNIGSRQSGRDRGQNVIDVPHNKIEIVAAVQKHTANGRYPSDPIYGTGDAGPRIAELLSRLPLTTQKRLTY